MNRREFLKWTGTLSGAGIAIYFLNPKLQHTPGLPANAMNARYEGLAKVTGQKVYARDFRIEDLTQWPQSCAWAVTIRATQVDKIFLGISQAKLADVDAIRVIDLAELRESSIRFPDFFYPEIFGETGRPPRFLGQPLALIIFKNYESYRAAKKTLGDFNTLAEYGSSAKRARIKPHVRKQILKYENDGNLAFSSHTHGGDLEHPLDPANTEANTFASRIAEDLSKDTLYEGTYTTQGVDHAFLEPENGFAWLDSGAKKLHLFLGTQSPHDDADFAAYLFSDPECPIEVQHVSLTACYLGGGFGGRDHSRFPILLALAAAFTPGRSIRMIHSREQQLQAGLKRHPSTIHYRLRLDEGAKLSALQASLRYDSGGTDNMGWAVAPVGAVNSWAAYNVPRAQVTYEAYDSTSIPAGSMRGFGAPQSQFATESLWDEIAFKRRTDPIAIRRKNIFLAHHITLRGIHPKGSTRYMDVLNAMEQHPLWKKRASIRTRNTDDFFHGIGIALGAKSYGTQWDSVHAEVALDSNGNIILKTPYIEMGSGALSGFTTAIQEMLGPTQIHISQGCEAHTFSALRLVSSYAGSQQELKKLSQNPRYTPIVWMPSAASASAYFHVEGIREACRIFLQETLTPALKLLQTSGRTRSPIKPSSVGSSHPLLGSTSWSEIAELVFQHNICNSVMVHGVCQGTWSEADFELPHGRVHAKLDALALGFPQGNHQLVDRKTIQFPSIQDRHGGESRYAACGSIAHVAVNVKTGEIRVEELQSILEAGKILNRDIVEGQIEGASAMGIGFALYEHAPPGENGPGGGMWNFHRYRVPRAEEVAAPKMRPQILPALAEETASKGIGEVVLNPVAPALANAVFHATGLRLRDLPMTPQKLMQAAKEAQWSSSSMENLFRMMDLQTVN